MDWRSVKSYLRPRFGIVHCTTSMCFKSYLSFLKEVCHMVSRVKPFFFSFFYCNAHHVFLSHMFLEVKPSGLNVSQRCTKVVLQQ